MVQLPKIWDLIEQFKCKCRLKGWWASEREDIIHANGEYHNLVWARKVYPRTFKSVVTNQNCPIRDGSSYRIVNISYRAWVLIERPPENVISIVTADPRLLRSTAIYDLSEAYVGKPLCIKLNETGSIVFREFESFLETEYKINFMNKLPPLPPEQMPMPERISLDI